MLWKMWKAPLNFQIRNFCTSSSFAKDSAMRRDLNLNSFCNGRPTRMEEAIKTLKAMDENRISPSSKFYTSILRDCGNAGNLGLGKCSHSHAIQSGKINGDVYINNSLINMYAKCGNLQDACKVFHNIPFRDVVSWTSVIAGHAQNGQSKEALDLFSQMNRNGIRPNQFTLAIAVKACTLLLSLKTGKQVHKLALSLGFDDDDVLSNSLVHMYATCGTLDDAWQIFHRMPTRNTVAWNAMISGYAQHGQLNRALSLLKQMPMVDEIAWSSLISGSAQSGLYEDALNLFVEMRRNGFRASRFALGSLAKACAEVVSLQQGRQIHASIIRYGFDLDFIVGNALVGMYGKCGVMEDAHQMFSELPTRNVVSWSSLIVGYAQSGQGKVALDLFQKMLESGICPNEITYVGVLTACSHAGLIAEVLKYFETMKKEHGILPVMEHYTCMVDCLGRSGFLLEAENVINTMPFQPNEAILAAFLRACRTHGNVEIAMRAERHVLELEKLEDGGTYTLLANIYASAGRRDDEAKIRKLMRDRGVIKEPGFSKIEVRNQWHSFVVGDTSHPQQQKIYEMLDYLTDKMKKEGYTPDTTMVLQDVGKEQKELSVSYHSEKLAVTFGLISTFPYSTIRVVKNLRFCADCHTFMKHVSRMEGRYIVVRDKIRFHHFKNGLCSCGDFW